MDNSDDWIQEAVLEFLESPLYEQPVMNFLDDRCLIFDLEEENKLEYTEIHEEFKEFVDQLLTAYLEDLGVSIEDFYDVLSSAGADKLNDLVVSTVLMVDDFPQFRAMMMKRNLELTNEVLEQLESSRESKHDDLVPETAPSQADKLSPTKAQSNGEDSYDDDTSTDSKALMVDEDDPELAWAIAASLRQTCANQLEIAELEQAIALSLAVADESIPIDLESGPNCAGPSQACARTSSEKECGEQGSCSSTNEASVELGHCSSTSLEASNLQDSESSQQKAPSHETAHKSDSKELKQWSTDPCDYQKFKEDAGIQDYDACCHKQQSDQAMERIPKRNEGYSGASRLKNLKSIRAAAVEAAEAQKVAMAAQGMHAIRDTQREEMEHVPKDQRKWLTNQCRKLVAHNKEVRNVQLDKYKKDKEKAGPKQPLGKTAESMKENPEVESKRAQLRSQLAHKFRQNLAHMSTSKRD